MMPEQHTDMDALLAKSLAAETSAAEEAAVRQWRESDPANQAYWDSLEQVWNHAPGPGTAEVDTEAALQKVKSRIRGARGRSLPLYRMLSAAAVVLLLLTAWWLWPGTNANVQEVASGSQPLQATLSDGSEVWLNRTSSLSASISGNKERRVTLTGEAYFEVKHDEAHPFIVQFASAEVEVLGTSFNIDNLTDTSAAVVTVTSGRVAVRAFGRETMLGAGQSLRLTFSDKKIGAPEKPDPNVLAYQSRRLKFSQTPVTAVISRLEEVYGVQVTLPAPLGQCLLTAEYDQLGPDRILSLIADSFGWELSGSNGQYQLKGNACDGD